MGLAGHDLDPVIDFGDATAFSRVTTHFLNNKSSCIYPPRSIEVFVSDDGQTFRSVGKKSIDADNLSGVSLETVTFDMPGATGRYLKMVAQTYGPAPAGASGAGSDTWLFLDEIIVD